MFVFIYDERSCVKRGQIGQRENGQRKQILGKPTRPAISLLRMYVQLQLSLYRHDARRYLETLQYTWGACNGNKIQTRTTFKSKLETTASAVIALRTKLTSNWVWRPTLRRESMSIRRCEAPMLWTTILERAGEGERGGERYQELWCRDQPTQKDFASGRRQ